MKKRLTPPWEFDQPLCAEVGPYYFYMEDDGLPFSSNDMQKVRSFCNSCVHQSDCAEWGIQKEKFGVWGGLTPRERQNIRRRRRVRLIGEEVSVQYRQ